MENIRRNIKIFWLEHSGPIKIYTLIIVGVIVVVQILNQIAIQYEKYNKNNVANNQKIEITEENKEDIKLINKFINYCKKENIQEAYNLISKDCKQDKCKTIEEFVDMYYNKIFNKNLDIEVEYDTTKHLYKVVFYEDILESGKIEGRRNITDYYKVQKENDTKKIYINANN